MAYIVKMPKKGIQTYRYWVYGLSITSEIRLDDLLPIGSPSSKDVRISFGSLSVSDLTDRTKAFERFESPGKTVIVSKNSMYIEWERVGRFLIGFGNDVIVDPEPGVTESDLQPFITGPVLSVILHQRGLFVLHSSAVRIGGKAVVFLGSKGDGKSTLAAHLQMRGHQLISDDLVPVKFVRDRATTFSGYHRIKLNEDSIIAVGNRPDTFPLVHRFVEKRSFRPEGGISKRPVDLLAVYILAEDADISLSKLNPAAAFIELTKHSFVKKFLSAMKSRQEHFQQCERLVRSIPIMRLGRPHDFAVIDEVCRRVEDHARRLLPETRQNDSKSSNLHKLT